MNKQTSQPDIERRTFTIELRDGKETQSPPVIEGYAAVFNSKSEPMWGFVEIMEPGFFDDVLGDDTRALFNHDRNIVLGRNSVGTLEMSQDDTGLKVAIVPPETSLINDLVLEPMRRGDIDQMSFAFTLKPNGDDWHEDDNGQLIRTLKKGGALRLYDVSVVTEPAYAETSASVRSKLEEIQQTKQPDQAASGGAEEQAAARRRELQLAGLSKQVKPTQEK